jgi:MOSC domain-containing protein YiiM
VQVGAVQPLQVGEQRVMSGIRKQAVHGSVAVRSLGLAGDEIRFPDCVLRVTQPRAPCYKLDAAMDDPTAGRTMARSGHSGFYLAVEVPGSVMAGQAFDVIAGPRETPLMTLFRSARAKHA